MVAATHASSRTIPGVDSIAPGAAMGIVRSDETQQHHPTAVRGDLSPAAGVLLAIAVSLPLWGLAVALTRMVIA